MCSIYHFLNKSRPLQMDHMLTSAFNEETKSLTALTRAPTAVLLKRHPKYQSVYSIMADKPSEPQNVLSKLGHVMERMFTEDSSSFFRFLPSKKQLSNPVNPTFTSQETTESYNHTKFGKILLRSQLDCHDDRLPKRTFDLKTRASLPIRMDVLNYQRSFSKLNNFRYLDYRVTSHFGLYESFEREFYDMCRSTMLKYKYHHS
jgi:hypothetical protein